MDKKYKLTDEIDIVEGYFHYRFRALRSFSCVVAGDLGGFVESEGNLSQAGNCWVTDNAHVSGAARVDEDAWVGDNARVFGHARVSGTAIVFGDAWVCGNAHVSKRAWICEESKLDQGIWDRVVHIDNKWYLVSTTLRKVLLPEY